MQRGIAASGALAVVLGVIAAALTVVAPPPSYQYLAPTAALAFGATGGLVALRGRPTSASLVLALIGLWFGTSAVARTYAVLALLHDLPLALPAAWLGSWMFAPAVVAIATVLPLLLPDGRLPSPRWRPAFALALTGMATAAVSFALAPSVNEAAPGVVVANPLAVPAIEAPVVQALLQAPAVAAVVLSLVSLVLRWRRGRETERQQLKWLGLGVIATVVLWTTTVVLMPNSGWPLALIALPVPVSCAIAALRHRLWDVDIVISRGLAIAVLTGLAVALTSTLIAVGGAGTVGPQLAAATAVLLVLPLQGQVRRLVNHLVHGADDDPATALTELGRRLNAPLLPEVVAHLAVLLRSSYVGLRLADGEVVETGDRPADVDVVDLRLRGTGVGALVLVARPRTRAERRKLDVLAAQTAVAVHSDLLARDLRRTRQLAVTAREEERRRLRHDLHDGLGPVLAGLGLQAETARDRLPEEPAAARALLDRMVPLLAGTVEDVRALVHDLRPPTLDELGLDGAVRELAERFSRPGLIIGCAIGQLGDLPAAVDVAAYRIVAEAIANAARHAGAAMVRVELHRDRTLLHVAVQDDGRGLDGAGHGVGLVSMRRRAEELDGTCEISSPGPGTLVHARIPVATA